MWKKQLQDQAAGACDPGVGRDGEEARERGIGQLTVERDFSPSGPEDERAGPHSVARS
jgi:hypothetical protein